MHIQLDLLCLFLYFSQCIFGAVAVTIRTGLFKVSRRSTKLRQCASNYLHKEEGFDLLHAAEADGQCSIFSGSRAEESMTQDDNYAKLISKSVAFRPPLVLDVPYDWTLVFPRVFTIGTKFSLYFTWPKKHENGVYFNIYGATFSDRIEYLTMWVFSDKTEFVKDNKDGNVVLYEVAYSGADTNITFSASGNQSLEVLIGGKTILTWELKYYKHVGQIRQLKIFGYGVLHNGFDFTQE